MRVLAIDPGYGRCGFAVVEKRGGAREVVVYSSCVQTSATADFPERLSKITHACADLLKKHRPDSLAIEKLYISKNQKTAMRVAEVRGALISTATELGVPVFEYTPGEVKSAAAGSGSADKQAVSKMLHVLLKIEKKILLDDEYDAIAIGVTHLARHRHS